MAAKDKGLTPMMKQFFSFKEKHPDALLLFRCGDFYETYAQDAIEAAKILGITLTRRNNGASKDTTAMAGFPHHALDTYLPKLIRAGRRVAICDQLEDPKLTKKLVKRGITELVTPGVAIGDNVLNNKENNFLAAIHFGRSACGVAFLDISTGEFLTAEGTYDYVEKLLANFAPKEILYNRQKRTEYQRYFGTKRCVYELDDWVFTEQNARQRLLTHFGTKNLKGFGVEHVKEGIVASGAIMEYLIITQHYNTQHITQLSLIEEEKYVRLDKFTIRSLELLNAMHEGGTSLLQVVDKTITPMGGRMLRRWIVFPLKSQKEIETRQEQVEYLFKDTDFREMLKSQLQKIADIERIASKIALARVSPREMVQLGVALNALIPIKQACQEVSCKQLGRVGQTIDICQQLKEKIEKQILPEPPIAVNRGNVIASGVNTELDQLREISSNGRQYLLNIQQREINNTGISSLKVGYNNVFGYYLEVRNTYKDKVPQGWIRKQTLAQAERYVTQELKEYEEKILGADEKIKVIEEKIYNSIVEFAQHFILQIQKNANAIATMDCLLSMANVAEENNYIRPVVDLSYIIDIKQGRHAVIEKLLPLGEKYVPNDIFLDNDKQQIIIITGPNMAGKSALLRQTALIVLMAQIGSFVPAESARIGLVDKIFTRVGASDNISVGESTFMVEMTEAANILNNVSSRSLVLFDELGRGTSTYDGISIAWAILEYLHEHKEACARTLFATHYHELNEMESLFARIKNYNVSVKQIGGKVIFMRRLERGGSEHSFGIHVADISGMPKTIVKRAETILKQLEEGNAKVGKVGKPFITPQINKKDGVQLNFFQLDDPILKQIRDQLLSIDVNNLTPIEALNKLNEIKKILS